jgi:membrane protein implicated in regulation of membrane protease activity
VLLVLAVLAAILWLPSPWSVVAVVGAAVIEVAEVGFWVWLSRRRKAVTGAEALPGSRAVVVTPLRPEGQVRIDGELWRARAEHELEVGEEVEVVRLDPGLVLVVKGTETGRN